MVYVVGIVALLGALVALLAALSLLSRRPETLGIVGGQLGDCPSSPNCVSSQAPDPSHHIEPLAFPGPPDDAMSRLESVLVRIPRIRIVTRDGDYLHAEATSAVFRFVDDLEFLLDRGNGVIQVRSASRVGRSDLGVNRRRMERIREELSEPAPVP